MTVTLPGIRMAAVATAILALAVGVACGNDPGDATPTSPIKAGNATKPASAPAHTEHAAELDQQKMTFIPARVSIKVGETVLIKNSETAIHTGNINGKNITGNMKKGDTIPWTATEPGEYAVTCEYHPQMKATIVVTA